MVGRWCVRWVGQAGRYYTFMFFLRNSSFKTLTVNKLIIYFHFHAKLMKNGKNVSKSGDH